MRYLIALVLGMFLLGCTAPPPLVNDTDGPDGPGCVCTLEYRPVCGADGKTYGNACAAGCANVSVAREGECASAGACTDSDGGKDASVRGTAKDAAGEKMDSCDGPASVQEAYCDGESAKSESVACPAGQECFDGACRAKAANTTPTAPPAAPCADSDSGEEFYTAGSVTKGASVYEDSCTELTSLKEYYCQDGLVKSTIHICEPGERCDQGRCVEAEKSCEDTDGGKDEDRKGTVTSGTIVNTVKRVDACASDTSVREYYCLGDDYESDVIECPDDHLCENGECREADCEDSDGGEDTSVKGTVTKGSDSKTDTCSGASSVKEYFCDGNDIESDTVSCGSGYECEDGECVPV